MSYSKLRRTVSFVALTCSLLLLTQCGDCNFPGGGGNNTNSETGKAGVSLWFSKAFDETGDDVGGAKMQSTATLHWVGNRVVNGQQLDAVGDSFIADSSHLDFLTDPWEANQIVSNLNPGDWKLSVTVSGQLFECPDLMKLLADTNNKVTFLIDQRSGQFSGCTQ